MVRVVVGSDPRRPRALELVSMIRAGSLSDERCAELLDELGCLIPYPAWTDLMFYRTPSLSDDETVSEALSYRPIEL